MKFFKPLLITALCATALSAWADVTVGVTISATGPAASLGIPEKNTISLMPKTIGGQKINYIVLDDASDTTAAVNNTRKLIAENKVDVILGSTTTPASLVSARTGNAPLTLSIALIVMVSVTWPWVVGAPVTS